MFNKIFTCLLFIFFSCFVYGQDKQTSDKKPVRVYVDMVGDLFHSGHVEFFKKARKHGDYLIVGVISDEVAADYKRKPILSLEERVNAIAACRYVDEVLPNCPLRVTKEWIEKHDIHLVIHGDDFDPTQAADHYSVPIKMGIFKTVPYTRGTSTSEIISRIQKRYLEGDSLLKKAG